MLRMMDLALSDNLVSSFYWSGQPHLHVPYFLPCSVYIPCRVERCLTRSFLPSLDSSWGVRPMGDGLAAEDIGGGSEREEQKSEGGAAPRRPEIYRAGAPYAGKPEAMTLSNPRLSVERRLELIVVGPFTVDFALPFVESAVNQDPSRSFANPNLFNDIPVLWVLANWLPVPLILMCKSLTPFVSG
jgi:hypothetical protein